ncbi:elongation factor G-like protein EF-G2 [Stackebrandtia nassauensis]|uniref:Elongation factor G-like protein n=1 Tax=Stackebrandtia nassauensis (strain DSM 44728 / CIP 108903 / NRRL B-16338 / NBRC 102104 / LLR-40K-21) TaxID=446470 RepID=D3Q4Q7_STANL|nr:elongation factor G-like protein EF-G2 [Stackebrandtia nassauensis]ADD42087.1 small GTP-binding protein [Stackebrandtia nassauensis DSM 44728]
MSQKNRERGTAGPAPAATEPGKVRNVALVGHAGVGKTTLAEALLAATGTIERAGDITEGTTVCDHDPAAIAQQRSVGVACAPLRFGDLKINLLDTPGYHDFVGELRAGLRAADAALFVVSAVNGLDAATQQLWEECAAVNMPRAVAITRLDHPQADFDETLALCRRMFGDGVLPAYLPLHDDSGAHVTGLIGLITQRVFDYSEGHPPQTREPDAEHVTAIAEARGELIEGVIAESEDETLMDRYLSGEDIDTDTLVDDLETAVARGSFHPVVPVNATTQVGLDAVLELISGGFPAPDEHPAPTVTTVDGDPAEPLTCDPNGPLAAEVIKTTVDSYVGRVSLVRVFSGTLRPDTAVHISGHGLSARGHPDHDADERVTHLYSPLGADLREVSECAAGDICAITKSGTAETGDTISSKANPLLMAPWKMPEPLLPIAITAPTRADEDAMAKNLTRLVAADPTLRLERNSETHQIVLWCMGESHAEVVLDRLRAGGTQVDTEPVRIALRETFTGTAKGMGRHVKQSGGHGQYGICHISVDPLTQGENFEFVNKIVGGVIPQQFVQSVEKGVRSQMERGLVAGYPVIDIRVTVYDGKTHSVDSSDAAFQSAGALALRDAAENGQLTLLEPIDHVAITVSDGYVGAVMSDLSSRRGRVLGTETDDRDRAVIRAEIPASELVRYAIELRAMTAGSGVFARTFIRYEPMPKHLAEQVKKEAAERK